MVAHSNSHLSSEDLADLLQANYSETELAELETQLACLEWSTSYRQFVKECLARDFPAMNDPGVQQALTEYESILLDWQATRHTQKTRRNVLVMMPRECCKSEGFTIPTIPFLHLTDSEIAAAVVSAVQEDMAEQLA